MHYFLYPTKDTTISNQPSLLFKNMGHDEILEVEKTIQNEACSGGRGAVLSRALIQFNLAEISRSIALGRISNPRFYLSLKVAESIEVPKAYNVAAYPLAMCWDNGTGYKYDGATTSDGASWRYSDSGSIKWYTPATSSNCDGGGIWFVSSSLLGSGSGYAEAPFVSPNPFNPFPDCNYIPNAGRFTVVQAGGMIVNSTNSSSLEVKIYSGSTINFSSFVKGNSGATPAPTTYKIELYDQGTLVATASGDGIGYFPSGSYNVPSGSFPRTLKLIGSSTTGNFLDSTLTIDGHLSGSAVLVNGHGTNTTPLKSLLGDAVLKGFSPYTSSVSGSHPLSIAVDMYSSASAGGTSIYAKYLGGSYVTSSVLNTTIIGTDNANLSINPVGLWRFTGTTSQIMMSSTASLGTSGSYEIGLSTDAPLNTIPYTVSSGSYASVQYFDNQSSDIYMDVTNTVLAWIYNSIPNYGFILMHSNETSSYDFGKLRFFSKESNTIYQPHLDVMWADVSLSPTASDGTSLRLVDTSKSSVISVNLNKDYKRGSIVRINVLGRPKYPTKTFTNRVSDYIEPMYLPEESYYSIKDAETEETVMAFDGYTKLSSDADGNYFMLDTTGLPQERYYSVDIRSEISGSISTFSSPVTFKISR
jgi:hypothetical protein